MSTNVNAQMLQNDEIDLSELWATLVKRKMTIIVVTVITTIFAALYAYTATPIYHGEALIEIGEVINDNQIINNNQPTTLFNLDNINNLKEIVTKTTGVTTEVPKETTNILKISMDSADKKEIRSKLDATVAFIMTRHSEKAKLYEMSTSKIRMTQMIGDISIGDQPIKPKKQLIIAVAFISGLMLGIFLAFFIELISNGRKVDEKAEKSNLI